MSRKQSIDHHSWWRMRIVVLSVLCFVVQFQSVVGLSIDGILLLSFKYSVLSDPLEVLQSWNYNDQTPCSWNGVTCGAPGVDDSNFRVVSVELPDSQLLGSVPADLGMIEHLQSLNLSNNSINGSIPLSLFGASRLRVLDLSDNLISGELPGVVGGLTELQLLNLSDNALAGNVPANLTSLRNLKVVSLKGNYFTGELPSGFDSVEILDLSSNLINGSLPRNFSGNNLRYLNVSYNRISGEIPPEFANRIATNATLDLSFNNITGVIPENPLFLNQEEKSYAGNSELCGKPLKNLCPIPSSASTSPNDTAPTSPPAFAAIPKTIDSSPATGSPSGSGRNGLRMGTIIGIVAGDVAGVAILGIVFLYVYQLKKKRKMVSVNNTARSDKSDEFDWASSSSAEESKGFRAWACLRKQSTNDDDESSSESATSAEEDEKGRLQTAEAEAAQKVGSAGALVTVDGDREMELETLLKASAYILGATGSSIMYKAVLEDGTALAVRRIGESGLERFRDFQNQVRVIGKLVHPNLVRIRGFYWGSDDKLVIYDFVPNGSLANARYRKVGTSPCHLPWEVRLKIARGVARGLSYIHDKKHVHGNLKPTNILLGSDMEPKIGDFGLERLVTGESGYRPGTSARNFGSKRSTASRDSFHDSSIGGATPSPSPSSVGCISPYYAPESLRSLKPNTKWDVFSFGIVLLELLTGKVIVSDEMGPGPVPGELTSEDKIRVLRMADVSIRADMEGKEEALLALLRLGFSCISAVPQKRPTMREVLHALEKFSSSSYNYGHH